MEISNNLHPMMSKFISDLTELIDKPSLAFYLQWLKLHLDQLSRDTLPDLRKDYLKKLHAYEIAKNTKNETGIKASQCKVI